MHDADTDCGLKCDLTFVLLSFIYDYFLSDIYVVYDYRKLRLMGGV